MSLRFSVRITHTFQCKTVHSVNALGHPSLPVSCPEAAQVFCGAHLPGTQQGSPRGFLFTWGCSCASCSTFEIEDSVKKHPFFLQIANAKSNFSKINKKCIGIEICSSGCSPEQTRSTKPISQSWQSMGCPSSLKHVAVDQRKQLKVRN